MKSGKHECPIFLPTPAQLWRENRRLRIELESLKVERCALQDELGIVQDLIEPIVPEWAEAVGADIDDANWWDVLDWFVENHMQSTGKFTENEQDHLW